MKILSAPDVERIPMPVGINLMREAFRLLSEGKVQVPLRTAMETEDKSGMALFMPSYAPSWNLFGLKLVSVYSGNVPPLPAIQGQMLVMDATNGTLLAMLDAPAVTALRTGAASGLATELLSLPNASTLAIFGTGVQAWSQVAGILAVRKIKQVRVKGTSKENEKTFCRRVLETHNIPCEPLGDLMNLTKADVICTATHSAEPLFERKHIRPGVHINALGSYKPTMREISEDIISKCKLVVDQRSAVCVEAGEIAIPFKSGRLTETILYAELGEIVKGRAARTSQEEITVFKSVGNAIQDLAIARHLLS